MISLLMLSRPLIFAIAITAVSRDLVENLRRVVAFRQHGRQGLTLGLDENPEVKAAQLSRLHRIESRVAAEFCRALGLRNPHHPPATALAATTLMLVDATLRTWYRDGGAPLQRTVDSLIEGVGLLGETRPPAVRRGRRLQRAAGRAVVQR